MLHRVQQFFKLNLFFVRPKISQIILKSKFSSLKSQIYLYEVILNLHLYILKEHLCHVYLLLNVRPDDPTYCFVSSAVFTVALYVRFCNKHFPSTTHFPLQLHSLISVLSSSNIFRLCDIIWLFMLGMHEYNNFNSFLLKFLWYGCVVSKFWLTISRNRLPIFVSTVVQKGGVKYRIFFLFLLLSLLFSALIARVGI